MDLLKCKPKRCAKLPTKFNSSVVTTTVGQRTDISEQAQFKVHVFYPILDSVVGEMNRRFSGVNCDIMTGIHSLNTQSESFLHLDAVGAFANLYEYNVEDLQHELHQARRLLERKIESGSNPPKSLLEFTCFIQPYKDAFHELCRLLLDL